jgi:excinuclease ABC subunit A
MVNHILENKEGTKLQILAPIVQNRKGEHKEELDELRTEGFARVLINGKLRSLDEEIVLDKKSKHNIEVVVDRIVLKDNVKSRLSDSIELALKLTEGFVKIDYLDEDRNELLSASNSCVICGIGYEELSPQSFSFNSPIGACNTCNGLGYKLEFDPDLIVPDPERSLLEGAVAAWGKLEDKQASWTMQYIRNMAKEFDFSLGTPWYKLPEEIKDLIFYGSKGKRFKVNWQSKHGSGQFNSRFEGIIPQLNRRMKETGSEDMRKYYMQFISDKPCPDCNGMKLKPENLAVRIQDKNISDITALSIKHAHDFFSQIELGGNDKIIAEEVLKEIGSRLGFLLNVGLHYLSLDRRTPSLSGGETQRIRLASQIGSQLVGVMYILDEPSIGLHQRDNQKLIDMLLQLRDLGNSVIVVEHDEDTIRHADLIVDFGPKAGIFGGEIVHNGDYKSLLKNKISLTGQYLSGKLSIPVPEKRIRPDARKIVIKGAKQNNLKNLNFEIPLGMFVCITGVSGSGKSSIINQTLYPFMHNHFFHTSHKVGTMQQISGVEHVDKIIAIDQDPIGRTPRSNPTTYIKLFDPIRNLFAQLPASKVRGYTAGRFSFNVKGGRCEACEGGGLKQIEMHFMADIYVTCEVCKGQRYNHETLNVRFKGKNIADVLNMDVQEAYEFFGNIPAIQNKLRVLKEVGLDYIKLGQSSTTLSGGEAQRIKLARELSKVSTGNTLYLLDEPTTGLHFDDINKLLTVLKRLVAMGNTVIVIEHNLDVIKCADWVIDLGPEGGEEGGYIIAQGTPEEIMKNKKSYTGEYLKQHFERSKSAKIIK